MSLLPRSSARFLHLVDTVVATAAIPAALLLRKAKRIGWSRLPMTDRALSRVGIRVLEKHYYEPWVDSSMLRRPLSDERRLPGLQLNVERQLHLLGEFSYRDELLTIEDPPGTANRFRFDNRMFQQGDVGLLYSIIRLKKPRRVVEVGSGFSTIVARKAIEANQRDDPMYEYHHVCIEPFEAPWLETLQVEVVRGLVETVGMDRCAELQAGDLLFVDSSHIIRPQGDVLFEYLELLPGLPPGVVVHVHDIFTPRDYPREWVIDRHRLWNEQYLLEALLTNSQCWQVLLAANYLKHHHFEDLRAVAPHLRAEHEPGSFYIEKVA